MKKLLLCLTFGLAFTLQIQAQNKTHKELVNLNGPVHTVRVERVTLCESGKCNEGRRARGAYDSYDIKGNSLAHRDRFGPDNPQSRLVRYPFGDKPTIVERTNLAPDGTVTSTDVYTYNDLSRQSECISYRPDGSIERRSVYSFNYEGRLAEQVTYDSNMQVFGRTTYTYDEKGNEIEWTTYGSDGSIEGVVLCEYEFDELGNWIKKTMTIKRPKSGELRMDAVLVYYRTITYH